MIAYSALVHPVAAPTVADLEKRSSLRHMCSQEALARPLDLPSTICWGASVRDLSTGGIGLALCYPFKPGSYLAVDIQGPGQTRTVLVRVVHAVDKQDGNWHLGCEFVTPLSEDDLENLFQ